MCCLGQYLGINSAGVEWEECQPTLKELLEEGVRVCLQGSDDGGRGRAQAGAHDHPARAAAPGMDRGALAGQQLRCDDHADLALEAGLPCTRALGEDGQKSQLTVHWGWWR